MRQLAQRVPNQIARQAIDDVGMSSSAAAEAWRDCGPLWLGGVGRIPAHFQECLELETSRASSSASLSQMPGWSISHWMQSQVVQDVEVFHRPYCRLRLSDEIQRCLVRGLWKRLGAEFSTGLQRAVQRHLWDRHNDRYGIYDQTEADEQTSQESSMTSQNDQLTPEQDARLPGWVEYWTRIGVSTQPADFAAAEVGVRGFYRDIGEDKKLDVIVHAASPAGALHAMVYASALLAMLPTLEGAVSGLDLADIARQSAVSTLSGRRDEPPGGIDPMLHQRLLLICGDLLALEWGLSYRAGSMDYRRIAYATFFRDLHGWEDPCLSDLKHDEIITRHAAMVYYGPRVAAISDRPCEIHVDEDGELHNPDGPAMRFRDGWSIWAIHGVHVGEQVIHRPETQTLNQIDQEHNAEVRRIRIERYGWQSYLQQKNALVVEHRRNEIEQTDESLMELEGIKVLVCACPSTGRVYAMEVDPDCQTIKQAQAYLSGGLAQRIIGAS